MILSVSGTERSGKEIEKLVFTYLIVTLVCAIFGAVYEFFSHGVYYVLYALRFYDSIFGRHSLFLRYTVLSQQNSRMYRTPLSAFWYFDT